MIAEIIFAVIGGLVFGYAVYKLLLYLKMKKINTTMIEKIKEQDMTYVNDGKKMKFNFNGEKPILEELK